MKIIYGICTALAVVGALVSASLMHPDNSDATNLIVGVIVACNVGFILWFTELLAAELDKEVTRG